ncbi:DUF3558 domain-containing protein [Amycolatopsis granulosa]|uniref:DUF3558 domain-containing protein n=1 Tax=Amycolatopsis granulosa TaxID=185684 RepID=UPI00141F4CD0|nr:DUF3558 domain-containing protein [Amycolatopsis granulosa]NIH87388.1 hypothetical protein [Amycolatopsis granulosa]
MTRMVRFAGVVAGMAVALVTAGCSTVVSGSPAPAAGSASRNSVDPQEALRKLDACALLDRLLTGEGFDPGERKTTRNECVTTKIDYGARGIALDPVQGLADYQAQVPAATPVEINGRRAVQGKPTGQGSCEFALEVGEHARAMATAVISGTDESRVCTVAQELATKLEPLLPRG